MKAGLETNDFAKGKRNPLVNNKRQWTCRRCCLKYWHVEVECVARMLRTDGRRLCRPVDLPAFQFIRRGRYDCEIDFKLPKCRKEST